ncbi:MAG TPA: mandelate racemase/muconate lactonizing enzyme family protein [Bryobacteraceae bacterium]|nr:mandelate racemase/muconate lactonizing enzyme family protein [Bryobacteraceae bacterium]
MKIASVQSHLLSYVLPEPLRLTYYGGERIILKRDAMLIRIESDSGLVGYAPGPGSERAKHLIDSRISPFLCGRTLADPDALRVQFIDTARPDLETLNHYCAVEIGLYDLLGKAKGLPVSELLGGRVREHIRLYGSAGMYMTPDKYAKEARAIADLGFRAYKMRAGGGPDQDIETVRLMREAVGPDFDLIVDGHTWWRMGDRNYLSSTIDQIAEKLADFNIAWLEEPLPPDEHEAYRRLKDLELVPLASGAHELDEPGYMDLILTASVDYVQMNVIFQGGYPTARRLVREIGSAGLRFALNSWGTALEVIAAAHLAICWPEQLIEWLEYPCYSTPSRAGMYPFPLAAEVLSAPLQIDHGDLIVPNRPGLGVEVDESVIQRYPFAPGPWSFFDVASPRETHPVTGGHSETWYGDVPRQTGQDA